MKSQGSRTHYKSPKNTILAEGESRPRRQPPSRFNIYMAHHLWVAISSLGHLFRAPFSTLMTSAVIAIALAMPTGMYVLLKSVQKLGANWDGPAQITVFLHKNTSEQHAIKLRDQLNAWDEITSAQYISPEQALEEFRQISGFGDVIDSLMENPLPPVLIVRPANHLISPELVEPVVQRIRKLTAVEVAQLDLEWLRRLQALLKLGERGVWLLASLLGLAILLVVGNTIRLTILNRRKEIVVTKLIGATDRFIRRPFLYTGFWYGLFGSLLAWLLVGIMLGLLSGPVNELSALYNSQFSISGLDLTLSIILLACGIVLGLMGSWLAVSRHLHAIEPI